MYARGSHQFRSKTSRLSLENSLSQSQRPKSQLESVHHRSALTSNPSAASISNVSYQPVKPLTRPITSSSVMANKKREILISNQLSTLSRMSLREEGSSILDRLNLESLAITNNDAEDDWKCLLSVSPMRQETISPAPTSKLLKHASRLTDSTGLPVSLETESIVIGSRRDTVSSSRGGRRVSHKRMSHLKFSDIFDCSRLQTASSKNSNDLGMEALESAIGNAPSTSIESAESIAHSSASNNLVALPISHDLRVKSSPLKLPSQAMMQFSSWRPPVQKSKTSRMLKAELKRKQLQSHPIVETVWMESSAEWQSMSGQLPNLQYRRTSNSRGRQRSTLRPKTTISSAMIADILPLEEPGLPIHLDETSLCPIPMV